jgi:ubiquinone/menaquinone biosynthesis C-methylase UbiE
MTAERVTPTETGPRYFEHLKRYYFAMTLAGGKKVLDAACGTGYGSNILALTAKQVTGIDISREAIAYAKAKYSSPRIQFEQMDVTKLRYPDLTFDAVVSFETIEHIRNYDKFLEEVRRVLKPGGRFIVSTPNRDTFGCGLSTPYVKYHCQEFSLTEFSALLKKHHFAISAIYGQDVAPKLRWLYSLRWLIVHLPFGKWAISKYQDRIESSDSKLDDSFVQRALALVGITYFTSDIIISKKTRNAIYFIALCEKL